MFGFFSFDNFSAFTLVGLLRGAGLRRLCSIGLRRLVEWGNNQVTREA